jgi:hypothetical protein
MQEFSLSQTLTLVPWVRAELVTFIHMLTGKLQRSVWCTVPIFFWDHNWDPTWCGAIRNLPGMQSAHWSPP